MLYFLETPVLRFVLLLYYRRTVKLLWSCFFVLEASIRIKLSALHGCSTMLTFLSRNDLNPSPFLGVSCSEQPRSQEKSVSTLWKVVWGPPIKSGPPSNLGLPSNSGLQSASFSPSILHTIPWNSANDEMGEGYIWVWSTLQTNRKQNANNRKDFKQ